MKLTKEVFANAFALTIGVTYLACYLFALLFPQFFMYITRSWFHLIDLTRVTGANLGLNFFILGLVSSVVAAWLFGYFLGWSLEYFSKKR